MNSVRQGIVTDGMKQMASDEEVVLEFFIVIKLANS
jgi:thiamine biosynthesis protein ThiC